MSTKKFDKNDFVRAKVHTKFTPGEALVMLRHLQGLSQSELAKLTGISQPNISAYALTVHPGILLFPDS